MHTKYFFSFLFTCVMNYSSCISQTHESRVNTGISEAATKFIASLPDSLKTKVMFDINDQERFNWHYIPIERKGVSLNMLDEVEKKAGFDLLHTALSNTGFEKTIAIVQLEAILKQTEGRPANDNYRDTGKYYFSIFGHPSGDSIWGWRFEGHHVSFNFSTKDNKLISATPGFMGSNPAIVLTGSEKGKEILKDESKLGFDLLHSLNEKQLAKAIISKDAPGDIITASNRKAMINDPKGIFYSELNEQQQNIFLQLLSIYIHRYNPTFAMKMMHEIEDAGLKNIQFAWAGAMQPGPGNPHYYRMQGPTIIIEYDNTQNNANHVHTVVRDLKNDFGGDELQKHYEHGHHAG